MVKLVNLRLTFRALQDMSFPIYSGSALRGIFGKSLKRVSCLAKRESCFLCAVRGTCPYVCIFENGNAPAGKNEEIPNPYVIEPMELGQKIIRRDEEFSFNCLLFGTAAEKISYVMLAWVKAGNLGFTSERTQARPVRIEQVCADNTRRLLYDFEQNDFPASTVETDYVVPSTQNVSALQVELKTPLRIQHDGHPVVPAKFTAQDFLLSLLRRQENMARHHVADYPRIDYPLLRTAISEAVIRFPNLHWFDWARYSSRQKKRIAMGGIMGDFVLEGNLSELYPYLKMGELFHLGKGAVLGMGKYVVADIDTAEKTKK